MNAHGTFSTVPACLRALADQPRWVGWRWETRKGKRTKPPRDVRGGRVGRHAHNDKPETWATLAEAETAFGSGDLDGVGLQLLDLEGYAALDFDKVRDPETDALLPWAAEAVAAAGSYAEVTPSETGLRIVGTIAAGREPLHRKWKHPEGGEIEFYVNPTTGRYITVTGSRLADAPDRLAPIDGLVDTLLAVVNPSPWRKVFDKFPQWVRDCIAHGRSGDRSGDFQAAVNHMRARGVALEVAQTIFAAHPGGPAGKYIEDGRLDAELRRSWDKAAEPRQREDAGGEQATGRPRIELHSGKTAECVEKLVAILRRDPDTYDFGGALVLVADNRPHDLGEHGLAQHVGRRVEFVRFEKSGNGFIEVPADPTARLVKQTLALGERRRLKRLSAVVTAPTITPEGRVLAAPGYDAATGLLLIGEGWPAIPAAPTADDARAALDVLMAPFRAFPFAGPEDRGALLAALLTAVARPALTTAPAFAFDAPVQGSGKTLLARSVGLLAGGCEPPVWPHVAGRDDEETRKRLFTMLRDAPPALIWDNVIGIFDSAALAAFLTAPALTDRVLGRSERLTIPNRALLVMTGNNLAFAGDLPRRVLRCRIDPRCETPFARRFDFDPATLVKRNRVAMAVAAVTLMRARALATDPLAPGDIGSFEDWARLVRQAVAWAGSILAPGEYGDPAEGLAQAAAADPEAEGLGELLTELADRFGSAFFSAADVIEAAAHRPSLRAALTDLGGSDRVAESAKSCGRLLRFREDRIVAGRKLTGRQTSDRRAFRVEAVQ